MDALEEIATEKWIVEPDDPREIATWIVACYPGFADTHRILSNVNAEDEEMRAVAALPELLRLALAVNRGETEGLMDMAVAALATAGKETGGIQ